MNTQQLQRNSKCVRQNKLLIAGYQDGFIISIAFLCILPNILVLSSISPKKFKIWEVHFSLFLSAKVESRNVKVKVPQEP